MPHEALPVMGNMSEINKIDVNPFRLFSKGGRASDMRMLLRSLSGTEYPYYVFRSFPTFSLTFAAPV
jgi:hypothetical protein